MTHFRISGQESGCMDENRFDLPFLLCGVDSISDKMTDTSSIEVSVI